MFLEHTWSYTQDGNWSDMEQEQLEGRCTATFGILTHALRIIIGLTPPTEMLFVIFSSAKFYKTQRVPKESFSEASNELLTVAILKYAEKAKPEKQIMMVSPSSSHNKPWLPGIVLQLAGSLLF